MEGAAGGKRAAQGAETGRGPSRDDQQPDGTRTRARGNACWHNTGGRRHCASLCAAARGGARRLLCGRDVDPRRDADKQLGREENSSVSSFLAPALLRGSREQSAMFSQALWLLLFGVPAALAAKCPDQCVCDQIQLTVTCVNGNLTHVPPDVDEITVKLDLRGNDLQELRGGAFKHTPYLTHLSLQRCNIRRVKEGAFRGLGRLVFLNLANNNVDILYQESLDGLTSLKQLMMDRNRVEEIQPGAFSQLGFLNLLSLTHNRLVYIPNMAFQGLQNIKLPELTRLDMSYNPMAYLGEEVVSMAKLTHLFLDHMSLQDMDHTAVSRCPGLVHLDVGYNQLRVVQPFSEGSPKLARLNLAGNPIYCNCYLRPLRYGGALGRSDRPHQSV
ncbi:Chondroadherin-like protein [Liparis tanakae]|uniref:Chondroadherin-like protein n=1 Tax=Liparis tanakae TaxID=230148 RepID=A0A4Z2GDF1_9TELE|nr:Chondroadherin-like protein [Liparis tanakae]